MAGNNPISQMTAPFISRFDWGALPPRKVEPMTPPITRIVSTWADCEPCSTKEECTHRVRELQLKHMLETNVSDIPHHFLVGGDGNIYEGRGWGNIGVPYPPHLQFADELSGKSIEIGLLGRPGPKPDGTLVKTASDCVAFGLMAKHIQEKLLFFWRSAEKIEFLSHYETNAPGQSGKRNFTDHDISKYTGKARTDSADPPHENAGLKSSRTSSTGNKDIREPPHENAGLKSSRNSWTYNTDSTDPPHENAGLKSSKTSWTGNTGTDPPNENAGLKSSRTSWTGNTGKNPPHENAGLKSSRNSWTGNTDSTDPPHENAGLKSSRVL